MKTWKFNVSMSVADSWIADGFDLNEDRKEEIECALRAMLPYAYEHEIDIKVTITKSPDPKVIESLQNGDLEIKD